MKVLMILLTIMIIKMIMMMMIEMLIILCCSYIHDFISNSNDGHDDYNNAGGD